MSAFKNSGRGQSGLHNTESASFPENQNSPDAEAEEQYPVHLFTFGQSSYRPASFIPHQKETLSKDKPNPFATIAEVGDGSTQFFKPPSTQQTAAPTWRMEYRNDKDRSLLDQSKDTTASSRTDKSFSVDEPNESRESLHGLDRYLNTQLALHYQSFEELFKAICEPGDSAFVSNTNWSINEDFKYNFTATESRNYQEDRVGISEIDVDIAQNNYTAALKSSGTCQFYAQCKANLGKHAGREAKYMATMLERLIQNNGLRNSKSKYASTNTDEIADLIKSTVVQNGSKTDLLKLPLYFDLGHYEPTLYTVFDNAVDKFHYQLLSLCCLPISVMDHLPKYAALSGQELMSLGISDVPTWKCIGRIKSHKNVLLICRAQEYN